MATPVPLPASTELELMSASELVEEVKNVLASWPEPNKHFNHAWANDLILVSLPFTGLPT